MRFTVSPEQHKFFSIKGYLELEELISEQEASNLLAAIKGVKAKSPGYPEENLFRSAPLVLTLAKKRGWGQIAAELIHKKPLRMKSDKFFTSSPLLTEPLDDDSCGMILDLVTRRAIFFRQTPLPENLYKGEANCYFLLIMTAKFLPEKLNPIINP
jgi:hypothetical protein